MRILHIATIFVAVTALTACGRSAEKETTVAPATTDTVVIEEVKVEQMLNGGAAKMSETIDNLALNADDLEPREAVAVLVGYLEIEKEAQASHKHKTVLETIRKFVDVYDIVFSNHGDKMRDAIRRNASSTGIDLTAVASQFRNRLHGVDEGSGTEAAPAVATDSTSTEPTDTEAVATGSDLFD